LMSITMISIITNRFAPAFCCTEQQPRPNTAHNHHNSTFITRKGDFAGKEDAQQPQQSRINGHDQ